MFWYTRKKYQETTIKQPTYNLPTPLSASPMRSDLESPHWESRKFPGSEMVYKCNWACKFLELLCKCKFVLLKPRVFSSVWVGDGAAIRRRTQNRQMNKESVFLQTIRTGSLTQRKSSFKNAKIRWSTFLIHRLLLPPRLRLYCALARPTILSREKR